VIEYAVFAVSPVKVAVFSESETVKVPCAGVRVTTKVVDLSDAVHFTVRLLGVLPVGLASSSGLGGPVVTVLSASEPIKKPAVPALEEYIFILILYSVSAVKLVWR
jgi:hypothetical protein